jgi:type IV secretory pathway VirB2 component (pilin)
MEALPSWFWIAVVYLSVFVAGLSTVWFFARRALRDEASGERVPRRRRRTMMRVIEYRLELLLLQPPSLNHIARKLRPYLVGVLGVTVGGLVIWGIWTHAGSWFAAAPAPRTLPTDNGSGMPWNSAIAELHEALSGPIAFTIGSIGLVGAGAMGVLGEPRRSAPFLGLAMAALLMSRLSAFGASFAESDQSLRSPARVEQPTEPTEASSAEISTSADEVEGDAPVEQGGSVPPLEAASVEVAGELTESLESDQTPVGATTTVHRHVSTDRQSHFGFGDALMMYGAYKLLTHESSAGSAVGAAPQHTAPPSAATHTQVLAPRHGGSAAAQQPKARVRSVYRPSRSRRSR